MLTIDPAEAIVRKRRYVQAFRSKHKRYDFYASPAIYDCIEKLRRDYSSLSSSDVINDLIEAGYKALFPVS